MTREERDRIIDYLFTEKCSCVIRNGNEIRRFHERGVKDLFRLLTEDSKFLNGAFIADKVVGKGAAALMVLGGIREVFADVISRPALELLHRYGVKTDFTLEVPHIVNRTHNGICPVEQLCNDCTTAEECLSRIEEFMKVAR
ncbi:MAG: DUF1893 domain-containing protein [Alistipes sp.]|nr:DUF1893 domain-containing protein [Alistipes sp.]